MEFIVKKDAKKDRPVTYPSSVRVGICIHNFDMDYPLGCSESIGYRSKDGKILFQNEIIGEAEPFSVDDVIGICMRIAPPLKNADP